MDCESSRSIALLAVQPKYATQLMDGKKRVEFRKAKFREDVSHVVVYASSPIKKILGYFSVKELVEGSPKEIWGRFHKVGGIEEDDYNKYYGDAARAVAIVVGSVKRLPSPIPLTALKSTGAPPQSYLYLSESNFAVLIEFYSNSDDVLADVTSATT